MIIKNKEEKFEITVYKGLGTLKGLMFKKIKNDGAILIFNGENFIAIHTFFVFNKIDLIYLNENKEVTKIKRGVKPFRILAPEKAKYILELKTKNNIKEKDKLNF